ncbi:MAG: Ribosomal large subunit pseudouridine synthase D [Chloroflexi bacterium ADurb.Bin325]|nr:MAG: Ribosomal large subunit pseudouridine synthase D [Chloroflexi bacterium ADurb.Bin325]
MTAADVSSGPDPQKPASAEETGFFDDEDSAAAALTLAVEAGGERLDVWLARQLPDRSRAEVQRWIAAGQVLRMDRPLKASYRVAQGDLLTVYVPASEEYDVEPEAIPLAILYEDADLLVVNKAAGMVVHPAAGNWRGTLVNAVLYHAPGLAGVGGVQRPGIVHRLDKDTSGVIVVAKNDAGHRDLQAQFQARTVRKEYLALAVGALQPAAGEIDAALGRDPRDRQRMAVRPANQGRPSRTQYETLALYRARPSGERFSLLACRPLTGRTHQIRVHLAHVHHPIVGDQLYGRRKLPFACPRQFLHAHRLAFRLPSTGATVEFTAPLPEDLQAVLDRLEAVG